VFSASAKDFGLKQSRELHETAVRRVYNIPGLGTFESGEILQDWEV
jgi:hypothetical protein